MKPVRALMTLKEFFLSFSKMSLCFLNSAIFDDIQVTYFNKLLDFRFWLCSLKASTMKSWAVCEFSSKGVSVVSDMKQEVVTSL